VCCQVLSDAKNIVDVNTRQDIPAKDSHQAHDSMLTGHIHIQPWVLSKRRHTRRERQALVHGHATGFLSVGWRLTKVHTCEACEIYRSFQIDIDHTGSILGLLSHTRKIELRID
jgi:hypothetical protein